MKVLMLIEEVREPGGTSGKAGGAESLLRDISAGLRWRGHEIIWWYGQDTLAEAIERHKPDICQINTIHNRFGMQPALYLQRHNIPHVWVLMDYWPFCGGRMLLQDNQRVSCPAVDGICDPNCTAQGQGIVARGPAPRQYLETVNGSYIVALNRNTADIYKRNGVRVDAVIGCGVDAERFHPEPGKREWGSVIASSAFPQYPTKGFHILKEAADRLKINVRVITGTSREQVAELLQTGSIFVFPSTYEETWGLCLTEAMATGLACIASNVCGPRAQITDGQNGRLFANRNVDELAGILDELLEDTAEQKRLGDNARAWVEQNATLDIMASRYEKLYKAVLNG